MGRDSGTEAQAAVMLDQRKVGSVYRGRDLISKHYKLGPELGSGAFAVVRCASSRANKRPYAVKIISKESGKFNRSVLEKEVAILKAIEHPNCMRLYGVYDEPHRTCLVLELVRGSNLYDRLVQQKESFSEATAAKLMRDVMTALRYLHSMLIVHRDIKPNNLMFASDDPNSSRYLTIMLCDFGLSHQLSSASERLTNYCGTPGFMAPEVLMRDYGREVDIWAVGVSFFTLLCGYAPFQHTKQSSVEERIHNMRAALSFNPQFWGSISENCKDLLRKLLDPDPYSRASAVAAVRQASDDKP